MGTLSFSQRVWNVLSESQANFIAGIPKVLEKATQDRNESLKSRRRVLFIKVSLG